MKTTRFAGKVVVVTGASSGIGRSLALKLASQGTKLVLAARRVERLETVASECRSLGAEVLAIPTDVSIDDQCKNLIDRTVSRFDRIDVLINNAGLGVVSLFDSLPDLELFRHVMEVNFFGAVRCTYYALPYLKKTRGRIVVVSSLLGKTTMPYNTPYCSSKFAIQGFFDALRMELKSSGVSVTMVCPSWVVTEFHEAQMDGQGNPRGKAGRAIYTSNTMTADRCAEIILGAADKRRREVLMGPGKLIGWLKLIAPGFLDWIVVNALVKRLRGQSKKS